MIDFLRNLRLSITQWLLVMGAGAIGLLVFLLRLQGSKLHKAQVDLLEANFNASMKEQNVKTAEAYRRMSKAYRKYKDNK